MYLSVGIHQAFKGISEKCYKHFSQTSLSNFPFSPIVVMATKAEVAAWGTALPIYQDGVTYSYSPHFEVDLRKVYESYLEDKAGFKFRERFMKAGVDWRAIAFSMFVGQRRSVDYTSIVWTPAKYANHGKANVLVWIPFVAGSYDSAHMLHIEKSCRSMLVISGANEFPVPYPLEPISREQTGIEDSQDGEWEFSCPESGTIPHGQHELLGGLG